MEYVTLAIAVIALIQPWVIAIWRRFFRQAQVDIHETGLIEVGYSGLGPTLGLHGTLRAIHRDVFVSRISLVVTRERDNARHEFAWSAFREGLGPQVVLSLPASFLTTTSQPHRANILFSDIETRQEIQGDLVGVREAWQDRVLVANFPFDEEEASRLYEEFLGDDVHVRAHTEISRRCYWDAGRYGLEMTISTSRPNRTFQKSWSFELTEQDAELLRRNTVSILRTTVGIGDLGWNTAYAAYLD